MKSLNSSFKRTVFRIIFKHFVYFTRKSYRKAWVLEEVMDRLIRNSFFRIFFNRMMLFSESIISLPLQKKRFLISQVWNTRNFMYLSFINSLDCFIACAIRNDVVVSKYCIRHCERSEAIQYNFYSFMYNQKI